VVETVNLHVLIYEEVPYVQFGRAKEYRSHVLYMTWYELSILKGFTTWIIFLKITSVLSLHAPVVYKLFGRPVKEKMKNKDFSCFYENTYEF
jgi:hypothetical protein